MMRIKMRCGYLVGSNSIRAFIGSFVTYGGIKTHDQEDCNIFLVFFYIKSNLRA